jgi:hypothetical protein
MDKLINKLNNIEDEIITIFFSKLNTNSNRYCFFMDIDEDIVDKQKINDNMLIKYNFNKDIIDNYYTIKDYISDRDIDIINLILRSIKIQTDICVIKYKNAGKIITDKIELITFIENNIIRTPPKTTNVVLIKIFNLILNYSVLNTINEIPKHLI